VGEVIQPQRQVDLTVFADRGFFEKLDHPVAGPARYATLPMRFSDRPDGVHRTPAPTLGQHTDELLGELGLTPERIAALRADNVVGETLVDRTD
jgi:crotonobetainyl-CoA:carnitine CoA-transferase CaiB-like acyl-CoA transferase